MERQQKEIVFHNEARKALKKGVDVLANAVKVTLGAKGRFTVFRTSMGSIAATKDGVSIANEVTLVDPIESMGADMVRQSSQTAARITGDGTTTATVIAQAIVSEGYRFIEAGANPIDIKRGIDKAVEQVTKYLNDAAVPVTLEGDELIKIATVSANGDKEIGERVHKAFSEVGEKGMVTAELTEGGDTTLDITKGVKIDRGFMHPTFITNPARKEVELEDPFIILYDDKIQSFDELVPLLEELGRNHQSVLIMTNDIEPEVAATLSINKTRGLLKVSLTKVPNFGEANQEIFNDIAVATGATVISKKGGMSLETATVDMLGRCDRVVSNYHETVIIKGRADEEKLEAYLKDLQEQTKIDKYAKERIARLTGGVAIIKVGAVTEVEAKEKKDRYDDAIGAVRSAVEEGVLTGGGATLVRASKVLDFSEASNPDEVMGMQIIRKAIQEPMRVIVNNSGESGDVAVYRVLSHPDEKFGYDVRKQDVVDMFEAGVLDPKKVTRVALESAASVGGVILTTECAMGSY